MVIGDGSPPNDSPSVPQGGTTRDRTTRDRTSRDREGAVIRYKANLKTRTKGRSTGPLISPSVFIFQRTLKCVSYTLHWKLAPVRDGKTLRDKDFRCDRRAKQYPNGYQFAQVESDGTLGPL
jgi:hypothetical protein